MAVRVLTLRLARSDLNIVPHRNESANQLCTTELLQFFIRGGRYISEIPSPAKQLCITESLSKIHLRSATWSLRRLRGFHVIEIFKRICLTKLKFGIGISDDQAKAPNSGLWLLIAAPKSAGASV